MRLKTALRTLANRLPVTISRKRPSPYDFDTPRYEYQSRFVNFDIPEGAVVVDVGSGSDPFPHATILCDRFLGKTVHRTEPLVRDHRQLIECDIHALPFPAKSVDYLYISHVMEHVDDPVKACNEIMRVASAGYIETPGYSSDLLFSWAYGMHKWYVVGIANALHFFEYSERQARGVESPYFRKAVLSKIWHPLQEVFDSHRDLFVTMFPWQAQFICVVHRLDGSEERTTDALSDR